MKQEALNFQWLYPQSIGSFTTSFQFSASTEPYIYNSHCGCIHTNTLLESDGSGGHSALLFTESGHDDPGRNPQ